MVARWLLQQSDPKIGLSVKRVSPLFKPKNPPRTKNNCAFVVSTLVESFNGQGFEYNLKSSRQICIVLMFFCIKSGDQKLEF